MAVAWQWVATDWHWAIILGVTAAVLILIAAAARFDVLGDLIEGVFDAFT